MNPYSWGGTHTGEVWDSHYSDYEHWRLVQHTNIYLPPWLRLPASSETSVHFSQQHASDDSIFTTKQYFHMLLISEITPMRMERVLIVI